VGASVLLVEDDETIGANLRRALAATGYRVEWATTLAEARARARDARPDLVLLDLGLPDGDGLDLCAELRADTPQLPVIMLTARSEEVDVVVGLDSGAVDYVPKPFRLAELLARVAAHLRFASDAAGATGEGDHERLVVGDLELDVAARRVLVAGREVALRPREFDLLVRLARDAGRVVNRETLMNDVWDEHWWGSTKTLDVHLNALRRKLGEEAGSPSRITAIRRVGYRLETG
jgi:DNA-binding response OmpR family regulator